MENQQGSFNIPVQLQDDKEVQVLMKKYVMEQLRYATLSMKQKRVQFESQIENAKANTEEVKKLKPEQF